MNASARGGFGPSVARLRLLLIVLALGSGACAASEWPTATLGPKAAWEAASDRAAGSRFIPMQLIVPGRWDGTHRIDMPVAQGHDSEGTVWTGPHDWRHPYDGHVLRVYDRRRTNAREGSVEQKMALRPDSSAIGRVYDSRFGGLVCDAEAKFPLGLWKREEVRTFDYVCRASRGGQVVERRRAARITIEELDYVHDGLPHSLRFAWRFSDRDSGEIIDHRTYILSPGRGLVAHARR